MNSLPSDVADVRFASLVYGGWALGRLADGRALFAPYLLPGERALVRVTESRTGYARGRAVELLEASPARVVPRCRHFGECGGCHYQQLAYEAQLAAKQQVLREQLARLAGLKDPPLLDPLPSPAPWNYRNHLRFHRAAGGGPGFRAFRSSRVVPIAECHLPEPALAERWPQLPPSPAGRRWILRCGTGGPPAAWQQGQSSPRAATARSASVQPLGAAAPVARGRPAAGGRAGADPAPVRFELACGNFRVSPESFFQANTPMAARLAEEVLRQVQGGLPERARGAAVLDLYCGVGLFSSALAPHVGQVVGVELSPTAGADFRHNLRELDNARLLEGEVGEVLPRLALRPEAAVADPPRAGLGPAVVRALAALAPGLLVYVSCDPATLARDARELDRQGYELRCIRLLDLFPQTYHLETLSVWSRPRSSAILLP
jgi:23S rRNA (uracil1939-C5)-methyltransferase